MITRLAVAGAADLQGKFVVGENWVQLAPDPITFFILYFFIFIFTFIFIFIFIFPTQLNMNENRKGVMILKFLCVQDLSNQNTKPSRVAQEIQRTKNPRMMHTNDTRSNIRH